MKIIDYHLDELKNANMISATTRWNLFLSLCNFSKFHMKLYLVSGAVKYFLIGWSLSITWKIKKLVWHWLMYSLLRSLTSSVAQRRRFLYDESEIVFLFKILFSNFLSWSSLIVAYIFCIKYLIFSKMIRNVEGKSNLFCIVGKNWMIVINFKFWWILVVILTKSIQ